MAVKIITEMYGGDSQINSQDSVCLGWSFMAGPVFFFSLSGLCPSGRDGCLFPL